MKTILRIITIGLAIVGLVSCGLLIREMLETEKLESAYECNCNDVKIGMTLDQAVAVMRNGLDINFRGYDHEITKENEKTYILLMYPTNGGSYMATIKIDPQNGLVTKTECPPKTCK